MEPPDQQLRPFSIIFLLAAYPPIGYRTPFGWLLSMRDCGDRERE